MKGLFRLILPLALTLLTMGCPSGAAKPEILFLITLDTTRADALELSAANSATPHFARLAQAGFYFSNAYTLTPITLPSHASMFFSQPPHRLKVYNNGQPRPIPYPSLAQTLKSNGFKTGAAISLGVLKAEYGISKGFDTYHENFKPFLWMRTAQEVTEDAIALISQTEAAKKKGERSFYWLHYSDPHEPYFPPGDGGRFAIRLNNRELYGCRSTDQPAVHLEFTLSPGENTLELETVLPAILGNFPAASFQYVKFRAFSLVSCEPDAPDAPNPIINFPADWTSKPEKEDLHYYSTSPRSTLTLANPRPTPLKVRLKFVYSLFTGEESRKTFYHEEVKYMDAQFGVLLAFLEKQGLYEKAAFVIVGDHGEGLGEYNNHYGHIHYLNKVYTHVPLIISGVGVSPRAPETAAVSTLDIAPTLLSLANVPPPGSMLGQSLLTPAKHPRNILLETYSPEAYFDSFSLIRHPWQIIFNPGLKTGKLQFINLAEDAAGVRDLNPENQATPINESPEQKKIRMELIQEILKISRILTATKGKIGKSSERHREILKSLGYL